MYPDYPFPSQYARIGGYRMHYVDVGQGPVVVMVHGNPTWSYYFRYLISKLSATHRVIALDHIGCGLSDKPQEFDYYCLRQHTDNLEALLDHLAVDRYSLVVHDWGGAIGMGLAVRYPERLEKIVVLNTAAFRSKRIPLRINVCRLPFIGPFLVRGLNGFALPATFMAVTKPLARKVAAAYIAPYDSWNNRIAVAAFVRDIPLLATHRSYGELKKIEDGLSILEKMAIPMLILWGAKDFCFTRHFYHEWCRRFPAAEKFLFEDGGHYLLEDKRQECGERIGRFLGTGQQLS